MGHKKHKNRPAPDTEAAMPPEDAKAIVRSDKYWRKTGNLFIETSSAGQPSGLMAAGTDYILHLLDDNGDALTEISLDAQKLSTALARMQASGDIKTLTVGDSEKTTGYLVPLPMLPNILQMMAGIDISAAPKQSANKAPIVITTDGSFRPGGQGGGHVILERLGSMQHRDDFRITLTWQATIRDSYESEVRGVLEALKYLEQGRKSCHLIIRCDNMGVVSTINKMSHELHHTGRIAPINRITPCAELWQEIADKIQVHQFTAEHARYNTADHDTVECHRNANHAARQWKRRGDQDYNKGRQ
jgi:ribonuclease HI